jgi:hypothetical protein
MFFIILISLLSYHAINYSSLNGSDTPPTISTTQPNSPTSPLLLGRNVSLGEADRQTIYNTNSLPIAIYDNSINPSDTASNYFIGNQYSEDNTETDPHKMKLKIICGCAVIVISIVGIAALVHHYS